MTAIKFLHGAPNRLSAALGWLATEWKRGQAILIYAPASADRDRLNTELWSKEATSFLPHCGADDPLVAETPIVITESLQQMPHDDCLLNLSDQVPPHFSRFNQLIEIVSVDEQEKLSGRDRFRYYRDRGYPIESRSISQGD